MTRQTPGTSHRGFTLIEVMVAIVVLAIAMPPLLWSMREAHVQRVDPLGASRARWLASEKLEDILADFNAPARGYSYLASANYPAEPAVSGFPGFSRSVSFSTSNANLVAGVGTGYRTVTVSVSYTDGRGTVRPVSVSTVVADY